eukprot:scaffold4418_cov199-Prasinococcus_capsulatus_cf.AAC.2
MELQLYSILLLRSVQGAPTSTARNEAGAANVPLCNVAVQTAGVTHEMQRRRQPALDSPEPGVPRNT